MHITTVKFRGQEYEVKYEDQGHSIDWQFLAPHPLLGDAEITAEEETQICDQIAEKSAKREWPHGS